MRKTHLSLFIVIFGSLLCLQNHVVAAEGFSKTERDALWVAFPELKIAEQEEERVYQLTREIIGEQGGARDELDIGQAVWKEMNDMFALSHGAVGSPELAMFLIDSAKEHIRYLRNVAADGKLVERQIYGSRANPASFLDIWQYEDKVRADIRTASETSSAQCRINSRSIQADDGTWLLDIPDLRTATVTISEDSKEFYAAKLSKGDLIDCTFNARQDLSPGGGSATSDMPDARKMAVKITTDAQGYTATVEVIGADANHPKGIAALSGTFQRINKAASADVPALKEVAACMLGTDHEQKVRVLLNDTFNHSPAYFLETSQGLVPLDSFFGAHMHTASDKDISIGCEGKQEEHVLLIASKSVGSPFLRIHVIRYNSARFEWQTLRTVGPATPSFVYLGSNDMKVIIPSRSTDEINVHTVEEKKAEHVTQKTIPASSGYRVIPITENDLNEGKIP